MCPKTKKIILVIGLMIFLITCIMNVALAATDNFDFEQFDNPANASSTGVTRMNNATKSIMGTAIQIIRIVGTGVSVIMLSYIGMKYMMAAPSERAEFKKSAMIYIVGAILIFSATNIFGIIAEFAGNLDV